MQDNYPSEQRGQSIILVAVAFVALLLFVAIAVDMSNAYVQRRTAQNAADAAALAGAQELGRQINGKPRSDTAIKIEMNDFGERNDIQDTGGSVGDTINANIVGYYLDEQGTRLSNVPPVGSAGYVPDDALGIEAIAYITAPTFFGGIFGLAGLPLRADAAVQFESACSSGDCLLPIAIHAMGFNAGGTPTFTPGECYNLWDGEGPGNFGWLNWSVKDFPCPSEVGDDCSEQCLSYNMNPEFCNRNGALTVEVGDKIGGTSGVKNGDVIREWLDMYIGRYTGEPIPARVVVYDEILSKGGCGKKVGGKIQGQLYQVAGLAAFQITGYRLSQGKGVVEYDQGPAPENCLDFPAVCVAYDKKGNPIPCTWETSPYNRITGIAREYTGGDAGNCHAVGNLLAPRLSR